ncbi:acyl carrier protein [Paenibacillus chitinolyticus]|uniref:acyl carrier protein n=1 Tax=Paenibacillus chitinolyticus TaxID=79263 RepID=UPI002DBF7C27|nr:acyl carrier protein [Paenibacillus chitinolyticus]MEC0246730.1 acyl carrier protein [Paenibacillus chitinolyticus]
MKILPLIIELMSDKGCGVLDSEDISASRSLYEIGFDSLRYMELVVLLEEKFSITMPDDALEITDRTKVGDIARLVEECVHGGTA